MTAKVEHSNAASAFIDRIKSSLPGGGVSDVEPKGSSSSTPSSGSNASAGGGGAGRSGSSGGGASSGAERAIDNTRQILKLVGGCVCLVGFVWYYTHDTPPNRAASDQAFFNWLNAKEVTAQLEEKRKTEQAISKRALAQAPQILPTSSAAEAKRTMIANCGRKVQEAIYRPDPGCFYFDNSDVSSNKTIQLWSRTSVVQIIPEYEDRPGVAITAANGSTCVSNAAESCTTFIRSHSSRDGEFVKFTAVVPGNQGLIAQFNVN